MSQIQKMSQCGPSKMTWTKKLPKCKKWWNGLSAEGAKANVRSALHSADDPPFFVFLSFSCIYVCCGSMCSMGSMWAQQSYSAVLHLHLWWYYSPNQTGALYVASDSAFHSARRLISLSFSFSFSLDWTIVSLQLKVNLTDKVVNSPRKH